MIPTRKPKVAWISPCIGVGGGDLSMLQVIRYATNIDFSGIMVTGPVSEDQASRAARIAGRRIRFHVAGQQRFNSAHVDFHDHESAAILAACEGADLVITWGNSMIGQVASQLDIPIVTLTQNEDASTKATVAASVPHASFYLACSEAAVDAYPPECRQHVQVIYNQADPARAAVSSPISTLRARWLIPESKKIVAYIGRTVREKRPDLLISMAGLHKDWHVIIQGCGPLDDQLRKLAQLHDASVTFLPWDSHVGDTLAVADAFALISQNEGLPLAMAEAWYAGVPVVSSWFTQMRHLALKYGELATMVEIDATPFDLYDALETAISPDAQYIRQAGEKFGRYMLSSPLIAKQYEAFVFESVCKWHLNRLSVTGEKA